jgi:hypothetical protein
MLESLSSTLRAFVFMLMLSVCQNSGSSCTLVLICE